MSEYYNYIKLSDAIYAIEKAKMQSIMPYNTDWDKALKYLLSLDALDIVFCHECEYHTTDDDCTHPHWDNDFADMYPQAMEYNYCSYGKRGSND